MSDVGSAFIKLRPNTSGFAAEAESGIGAPLKKIAATVAGAFAAVKVADLFKDAIQAGRDQLALNRLTEQAIRSTGAAAGITAGHVSDLATKMSGYAGVQDDVVQGAENMLLRFTDIRNQGSGVHAVFDRATKDSLDLATAMGEGPEGAAGMAKVLGRALQDPVAGMTALRRAGVVFSESQKDVIKNLVETGQKAKAQELILTSIETRVGGAAGAAADPVKRLSAIWQDALERIGIAAMPVVNWLADKLAVFLPKALDTTGRAAAAVADVVTTYWPQAEKVAVALWDGTYTVLTDYAIPALQQVRDWAQQVADYITTNWPRVQATAEQVWAGVAAAVEGSGAAKVDWSGLFAGLQDQLAAARGWASDFAAFWSERWQSIHDAAVNIVRILAVEFGPLLAVISSAWDAWGGSIVAIVSTWFGWVQQTVRGALDVLSGIIDVFLGIFTLDWSRAWQGVQEIVSGVWRQISATVEAAVRGVLIIVEGIPTFFSSLGSRILSAVGDLGRLLWNAGGQIVEGLKNGIANAWGGFIDWVKGLPGDVVGAFTSFLGISSPSKVMHDIGLDTMAGLKNGIAAGASDVLAAAQAVVSQIVGMFAGLPSELSGSQIRGLLTGGFASSSPKPASELADRAALRIRNVLGTLTGGLTNGGTSGLGAAGLTDPFAGLPGGGGGGGGGSGSSPDPQAAANAYLDAIIGALANRNHIGELSNADFKAILVKSLDDLTAAGQKGSDEYVKIFDMIDRLSAQEVTDADAASRKTAQIEKFKYEHKQETAQQYLEFLKAELAAEVQYSDAWFAIQAEIDRVAQGTTESLGQMTDQLKAAVEIAKKLGDIWDMNVAANALASINGGVGSTFNPATPYDTKVLAAAVNAYNTYDPLGDPSAAQGAWEPAAGALQFTPTVNNNLGIQVISDANLASQLEQMGLMSGAGRW